MPIRGRVRRILQFDALLQVASAVVGVTVGFLDLEAGFAAIIFIPLSSILLSLVSASFSRGHERTTGLVSIAAVNAPWIVTLLRGHATVDRDAVLSLLGWLCITIVFPIALLVALTSDSKK